MLLVYPFCVHRVVLLNHDRFKMAVVIALRKIQDGGDCVLRQEFQDDAFLRQSSRWRPRTLWHNIQGGVCLR